MTTLTFFAISSLVGIIVFVTSNTSFFDFYLIGIFLVTAATSQVFMAATQREFGVLGVIKFKFLPAFGRMAFLAFFAIVAPVNIIRLVTGYASYRRF